LASVRRSYDAKWVVYIFDSRCKSITHDAFVTCVGVPCKLWRQ